MADKGLMLNRAARLTQSSLHRTAREAANRATGIVDHAIWVELPRITLDTRIQVRVGGLNAATVERYATIMQENGDYEPFPPVVLFREDETLWLSAGFHRLAAARQVGLEAVKAEVRPGGFQDAYWHAITDNLSNGLQMNSADQKEALRRLLGLDIAVPEAEEYVTMSNRQLAGIIGVSHTTIRKWRTAFERESGGNQFPPDSNLRMGTDGKVYDVSNIQDSNRQRMQPDEPESAVNEQASRPAPTTPFSQTAEVIVKDSDTAETVSPELERLVTALQNLVDAADIINKTPDDVLENLPSAHLDTVAGLVTRAFESLNGYENRKRQWVTGALDRLEQLYVRLLPDEGAGV
jgi:transposase-like protein